MSKVSVPKQFLDVLGLGETLIQMTFKRLTQICPVENIFVVSNHKYKSLILEQLPEVKEENILLEPMRKNTAPCIAYAAHKIQAINPYASIIVAPSDHLITETERFKKIISISLEQAEKENCLVTIGIKPSRADTGYGYIKFDSTEGLARGRVKQVKKFTEKPGKEMAELFLKSGDYYWNSGIFIWSVKSIIESMEQFQPELNKLFSADNIDYNQEMEQEQINDAFGSAESISVDFAILENANNVFVVLADFGWSDLGTWGSLYTELEQDFKGNAVQGENSYIFDCKNSIIKLPDEKLAVLQGLDGHIVVESEGVLLVIRKDDEQNIKKYLAVARNQSPDYFDEE